jgi:hypothetical protein
MSFGIALLLELITKAVKKVVPLTPIKHVESKNQINCTCNWVLCWIATYRNPFPLSLHEHWYQFTWMAS